MAEPSPQRDLEEARLPLSRERVLRAAVELADEAGLESVTMRKLAADLGYEAMSLYNHVANKDDLVDGMLGLVLDETEMPRPGRDWKTEVRGSAISVYEALRRHTWAAARLLGGGPHARLLHMDALLGCLRDAGFSPETTYTAYHVLDAHIFGFSLWHASHTFSAEDAARLAEQYMPLLAGGDLPNLFEHAQQHFAEGPHHDVSAFEFGLDLILDGLERLRDC